MPADRASDEERSHLLDVLRGLHRATHRLHDMRERMKLRTDQSNQKLVVIGVEAVTGEPHVVREVLFAVRPSNGGMLTKDAALLSPLELLERTGAPKRIPDRPVPLWVQHRLPRAVEEPELEVLLVAAAVCPADHRELWPQGPVTQGFRLEEWANRVDEERRVLAEGQKSDASRVVRVRVDNRGNIGFLQRGEQGVLVAGNLSSRGNLENQQLNEQKS